MRACVCACVGRAGVETELHGRSCYLYVSCRPSGLAGPLAPTLHLLFLNIQLRESQNATLLILIPQHGFPATGSHLSSSDAAALVAPISPPPPPRLIFPPPPVDIDAPHPPTPRTRNPCCRHQPVPRDSGAGSPASVGRGSEWGKGLKWGDTHPTEAWEGGSGVRE